MTCARPGCGRDAACDAYDVYWSFLASYCLEHGREAFAREGERLKALGLRWGYGYMEDLKRVTPKGTGGVYFLRPHAPGTCVHGGERRSCPEPECWRDRVWDDDLAIDDEDAREMRRQGFKVIGLLSGSADSEEEEKRESGKVRKSASRPEGPEPKDPAWLSEFFRRMGFRIHRARQASEPDSK